jgi:hypothetical protein
VIFNAGLQQIYHCSNRAKALHPGAGGEGFPRLGASIRWCGMFVYAGSGTETVSEIIRKRTPLSPLSQRMPFYKLVHSPLLNYKPGKCSLMGT